MDTAGSTPEGLWGTDTFDGVTFLAGVEAFFLSVCEVCGIFGVLGLDFALPLGLGGVVIALTAFFPTPLGVPWVASSFVIRFLDCERDVFLPASLDVFTVFAV